MKPFWSGVCFETYRRWRAASPRGSTGPASCRLSTRCPGRALAWLSWRTSSWWRCWSSSRWRLSYCCLCQPTCLRSKLLRQLSHRPVHFLGRATGLAWDRQQGPVCSVKAVSILGCLRCPFERVCAMLADWASLGWLVCWLYLWDVRWIVAMKVRAACTDHNCF